MTQLFTPRLCLRRFSLADQAVFFRLHSAAEIVRYTARAPLNSLAEAAELLGSVEFQLEQQAGFGRFACEDRNSGLVLGLVSLRPAPEFAALALGLRFVPESWGQGLAVEAATALLAYAHQQLQQPVVATVLPDNKASIRVLEKLGMRCQGAVLHAVTAEPLWLYQAVAAELSAS